MENGKFKIVSTTKSVQYEYTNATLSISGTFNVDSDNKVRDANGQVFRVSDGEPGPEYVCNFSGYGREDGVKYTTSEMSPADVMNVMEAIEEIEKEIKKGVHN